MFSITEGGGGGKTTSHFMFLKYCENVIAAQNMLIKF